MTPQIRRSGSLSLLGLAGRLVERQQQLLIWIMVFDLGVLLALRFSDLPGFRLVFDSTLLTTTLLAAVIAGPWAGAAIALADSLLFWTTGNGPWTGLSVITASGATLISVTTAGGIGYVARSLRAEITLRQEEASRLSRDLERVLELAPTLHSEETASAAAHAAACAAYKALGTHALLWRIAGDELQLVSASVPLEVCTAIDAEAVRPGLSILLREPAFIADLEATDGEPWDTLRRGGFASTLAIPVSSGSGDRHLLVFVWQERRSEPTAGFLAVAQRFADQVGLALAKAESQELHEQLQKSLIPTEPLTAPGVRVTTLFRPSEARLLFGGDFFGVSPKVNGGADFIIGDVSGHGPDSAGLGTTLRAGWRAMTEAGTPPDRLLASLDSLVKLDREGQSTFATVVTGVADPGQGHLALVSLGHPPPILISGGEARLLSLYPHAPLGYSVGTEWSPASFPITSGWRLILYTDGLFEGRATPLSERRYGLERLASHVSETAPSLDDDDLVSTLLEDAERAHGGRLPDDVAIVLLSDAENPDDAGA